jgi:hypothetical protein
MVMEGGNRKGQRGRKKDRGRKGRRELEKEVGREWEREAGCKCKCRNWNKNGRER